MVDSMKKFILVLIILFLSVSNVLAQYKRKLKEPDFFIPYNDRMHKPEVLPEIKKIKKSINKTPDNKYKNETLFKEIPEYKKIYDNYLKEIYNFRLTKKFEENKILNNDLTMMINGEIFEVGDDTSLDINTQEQYDFYMLAKKMLDN